MKTNLFVEDIFELFEAVQKNQIFEDQKRMADAIPKSTVAIINEKYAQEKGNPNFDLKKFVQNHFTFKETSEVTIQENLPIEAHIHQLWKVLARESKVNSGSLMALPKPYIVPGGRFNEFFYWDSYFVMLGLQVSGEKEMATNIVDNCSFLIQTVGFVPNGNRTYFLSRSQPPFFSLMVELLAEILDDVSIFKKYADSLEKEYQFWMRGSQDLTQTNPNQRVAKLQDGAILNRYFDAENKPRPESYLIDLQDQEKVNDPDFYSNIRSACESGWDFSSRWFADQKEISTIEMQNIIPVDLNCLLFHLEDTLSRIHKDDIPKSSYYRNLAKNRGDAIEHYFWNEEKGMYFDFHLKNNCKTKSFNIATIFPLYFGLSNQVQAEKVAENLDKFFLQKGGLVTTTINSGQQWDSPNAWAPFQWMAFKALKSYGLNEIAEKIKNNWCNNVERVYENTGKLMEKYDAVNTDSKAGGGEYPNQDGFGWTNGVYLKLKKS